MSNYDRSSSRRTQMLKARTLAVYHNSNPPLNDYGGVKPSNDLTLLLRTVGEKILCDTPCCEPVCDLSNAFFFPFDVTNIPSFEGFLSDITGQSITVPAPPDGYPEDQPGLCLFFPEICNATTYEATTILNDVAIPQAQYFLGIYSSDFVWARTGFIIVYPLQEYDESVTIALTASNECSDSSTTASYGCFLAGSQIACQDGSTKAIEKVQVGDKVKGAFGEINTVLALHRPFLGSGHIVNVNGEHKTTTHHPHISATKQFLCVEPSIIKNFTYGKEHNVIVDRTGRTERRVMQGVKHERIQALTVGSELQTLTGGRRVDSLEPIVMSPFTQVYHLAVSGSHTYVVDGYAVTGWPREDDFDYDAWAPK
jgi:hypothetical protein